MKKLDELGISPAPWKLCRDGEIVHGNGYSLTDGDGCFVLKSDARLIAAAPNMYKTEYDLVDVVERLLNGFAGVCDTPSQDEVVAALDAAKKALSKATGDEPAND